MKTMAITMLMLIIPFITNTGQKTMKEYLRNLKVARPFTYQNLTIYPLTMRTAPVAEYVTLDEAMKRDWLTIREIGAGDVNVVELRNRGDKVVFLMTGEMLTGAKQDRMLSQDVLVTPASAWLRVPVYCVEHGRWTSTSPVFKSSELMAPNELRKQARVTGNQSEVWDAIATSQDRLGIASTTGTARANYEDEGVKEEIDAYTKKFRDFPRLNKNTIGVVVTTGSRIICVDIFANNSLLQKFWYKLIKSYAMDALSERESVVNKEEVQDLLTVLANAHYVSIGTPGLGSLFTVETDFGKGSVLLHMSIPVHMDFFISNMFAEPQMRLDMRRDQRLND